jgi:RNA-directed DNA polymerase
MLWRWAARRHPNKGTRWVKEKYFNSRGLRNWVFAAALHQEDGMKRELTLLRESDTPIHRHIKIQASANPHDPQWTQYFESRWGKKMLRSAKGRRKLYRVWLRQDGLCPTCKQPITKATPWRSRHVMPQAEGGSDAASNLCMYHLNCRRSSQYAETSVM